MKNQELKYKKLIKTAHMIGQIGDEFFSLESQDFEELPDVLTFQNFQSILTELSSEELTELLIEGIENVDSSLIDPSGKSALCSYVAQSHNFESLNEEQKKSIADQILGSDPEQSRTTGLARLLIDRSEDKSNQFSVGLLIFLKEIKLEQAILIETPRESPDEPYQAPNPSPTPTTTQ